MPKLLKFAGNAILPSLISVYCISTTTNQVPIVWKNSKVSAVYKKEDDTDKNNYRPISLCIPGKIMETSVELTLTSHIRQHNLTINHQWAYKKGYSTEMLMIKMIEDWRRALDNRQVISVVFIDLKKVFD